MNLKNQRNKGDVEMKRKWLVILMIFVIAFQSVACSSETDEKEGQDVTKEPAVTQNVKTLEPIGTAIPSNKPTQVPEQTVIPTKQPTKVPEKTKEPLVTFEPVTDNDVDLKNINNIEELESIVEKDVEDTVKNLETEWETLIGKIDSYAEYNSNIDDVKAFYNKVNTDMTQICSRLQAYSIRYGEIIMDSNISIDDMYDGFDDMYDFIYCDMADEIYDAFYCDILDEIYDEIYSGILDDAYDTISFDAWKEVRTIEFDLWKDTRSDVFDTWKDTRGEIYDFWKDVRGELWDDDLDKAKEELLEYKDEWNGNKEETNNVQSGEIPDDTKEEMVQPQNKDDVETGTDGYFQYKILDKNSIEITKYTGSEKTVTIPSEIDRKDVTHIGAGAFENCTTIENFIIWADIEVIGDKAFKGCTGLEEISISSYNEHIGKSAFENCTSLEKVIFWNGKTIDECAFKGCLSLEEISIPSDVEFIGKSAFENCTELDEVIIWGTEEIGENAFKGCISIEEISIPSDTKKIGSYAFYGCTGLEDVTIWGNDTELGTEVFGNCPNLKQ